MYPNADNILQEINRDLGLKHVYVEYTDITDDLRRDKQRDERLFLTLALVATMILTVVAVILTKGI